MKERPIIFTGESVRAILDGRKTMTRRVIKEIAADEFMADNERDNLRECCPYGKPGDRLWVRETWQCGLPAQPSGAGLLPLNRGYKAYQGMKVVYRADSDDYIPPLWWRSPLFLPRWASRITLEITELRVEGVQEITEAGAKAEGVVSRIAGQDWSGPVKTYRTGFVYVWNEINAKRGYGWDKNPWVWVISFRRVS